MADFVPIGSQANLIWLALLFAGRGADILSTWIATPNLVLEGNPLAKRLGWTWGLVVNLVLCLGFSVWPLSAIVISTTSILVAARNFQSAWLMRSLGEETYHRWYAERLRQTSLPLYLFCLVGQVLLMAALGAGLMFFYDGMLVPFAVGMGIVAYAVAVTVYTLLSIWRIRRAAD